MAKTGGGIRSGMNARSSGRAGMHLRKTRKAREAENKAAEKAPKRPARETKDKAKNEPKLKKLPRKK